MNKEVSDLNIEEIIENEELEIDNIEERKKPKENINSLFRFVS